MGEAIMVGMGEIKFAKSPDDVLIAWDIGSGIAICAFDSDSRSAAMAHVMLPESPEGNSSAGKFADTAVPFLLKNLVKLGAKADCIRIALAGGAQLFAYNGTGPKIDLGPRNCLAVLAALEAAEIKATASDLGGSSGRSVQLSCDGTVRVKRLGKAAAEIPASSLLDVTLARLAQA